MRNSGYDAILFHQQVWLNSGSPSLASS